MENRKNKSARSNHRRQTANLVARGKEGKVIAKASYSTIRLKSIENGWIVAMLRKISQVHLTHQHTFTFSIRGARTADYSRYAVPFVQRNVRSTMVTAVIGRTTKV